jgi:DNA-binding CsgD family transcriptional regulator
MMNYSEVNYSEVNYSETNYSETNYSEQATKFVLSALECLETLIDGVMLVSGAGDVLYRNETAKHICQNLNSHPCQDPSLPEAIWETCQGLGKRDRQDPVWLSAEAEVDSYRVRVQRFHSEHLQMPCFMVRLEDRQQSFHNQIATEILQYGLTQREAEVWQLKRSNLSRQEIASQLYISVDTVKKHLCNIQTKRQLHNVVP